MSQKILHSPFVWVDERRVAVVGTGTTYSVLTDGAGIPGCEGARFFDIPSLAVVSGATLDVAGDVAGNVEQHHVVSCITVSSVAGTEEQ